MTIDECRKVLSELIDELDVLPTIELLSEVVREKGASVLIADELRDLGRYGPIVSP